MGTIHGCLCGIAVAHAVSIHTYRSTRVWVGMRYHSKKKGNFAQSVLFATLPLKIGFMQVLFDGVRYPLGQE